MLQSMGRAGSALDNAAAEAFNSAVKVEYIHQRRFVIRHEAPAEGLDLDRRLRRSLRS
ncbi:hypothetical protein [Actinoplanes regularis]|uniref:hypothetical protein n=1 Tax=Actinoplanes regularis TaxID=52697 RepID=UPI0015C5AB87|nr:hypothetical protein [Actinoplanes regularis]GIE84076.1 hypothetical protein Are01nite_05560 [Actinoplanes regularis]